MDLFLIFVAVVLGLLVARVASVTLTSSISGALAGSTSTITATGENVTYANPDVAAAKTGTLTVRTSGTVGSLTMATGHGIITGQRFDLYWSGGQCYGCIAGTVSGLVVPIASVSGGDALPAAATTVYAGIINTATFNVVGANMQALTLKGMAGYIVLADGSGDLFAKYVTAAQGYAWIIGSGITNPIAAGTATKVYMSQRGTAATDTGMMAQALVA